MKWRKPENSFYTSEIVAYGETPGGVPIIAHRMGVYPSLVDSDGKEPGCSDPTVTIYVDDERRPTNVCVKKYYQGSGYCEDLHIELKRVDAAQAVTMVTDKMVSDALQRLDKKVSEHGSLMKKLWGLPAQMSRKEYECTANEFGVDIIPDGDIQESYGIKFGDFRWPEYTNDYITKMLLARCRLKGIEGESVSPTAEKPQENTDTHHLNGKVVREYTMLVPVALQHKPLYREGEVHVPVKQGAQIVINEDMPSYEGEHLLGHEGEQGVEVTYEVRRSEKANYKDKGVDRTLNSTKGRKAPGSKK